MTPTADHSKPFARASLVVVGLAWSLPFLQSRHGYPLTAFYSEWLAFGLGLAAAMLLLARRAWRDLEIPVVALAPPAFALVLVVQAALGRVPYPEQAVTATFYLLWASLLMLLARVLQRELGMAAMVATLAWFLLAAGLLDALAGYVQGHSVPPGLDFLITRSVSARVYGNLGQPNQFAAHIVMALCSAAFLYGSGRIRAWAAVASAAWLLPALALSGSRSPWFYLALIILLSWALRRARGGAKARRLLVYSLSLLPGFVVAGFVVAQWGGSASAAASTAGEPVTSAQRLFEAAAGLAPRIELAGESWQMFISAPVLGVGWGQFAWHHFLHVAAAGATAAPGVYNHAHNLVLHLLAETGATGTLVVIGAVVLWIADLRRVQLDLEWWWILALVAVLGAYSMVEYPLWYSYFLGVLAPLLGLSAQSVIRMRLPAFARFTVAMLLLAGWFNLVSVMLQYREFERLVFLPSNRSVVQLGEKAFAESIGQIYREPTLAPYVELALAFGFSLDEQNLPEKLAITGRAARFAPVSHVVYHQALFLALGGERDAALLRLDQAAHVYPGDLRNIRAELVRLAQDRPDAFKPLLGYLEMRLR